MERRSLIQLILVAPILALLERLGLYKKPLEIQGTDEYVDFGPVQDFEWRDKPFSMTMWSKHTPEGPKILETTYSSPDDDGVWHTHTWRS